MAGRKFLISSTFRVWADSEAYCVSKGTHLASLHSYAESQGIRDEYTAKVGVPHHFYIGATDAAQEGVWVWTDGSPWDYSNWAPVWGSDNAEGIEHCSIMYGYGSSGWNDNRCDDRYPCVCNWF